MKSTWWKNCDNLANKLPKRLLQLLQRGAVATPDEAFLPDHNPQSSSAKKKKKKEKEKDQETDEEDPIPCKLKSTTVSPCLEHAIWRAMNDLGLATSIFPQEA